MSTQSDNGSLMDAAQALVTKNYTPGVTGAPIAAMTPESCKSSFPEQFASSSKTTSAAPSSILKGDGEGGEDSDDEEEEEEEVEYEEGPVIASETENDVLCGRGRGVGCKPGNVKYNKLIASKRMAYRLLEKKDKQAYAAGVLKQIEELEPPGRFLCLDRAGKWKKLSRRRTLEKICTALRKDSKKKVGGRYLKDRLNNNRKRVWAHLAPYISASCGNGAFLNPLAAVEVRPSEASELYRDAKRCKTVFNAPIGEPTSMNLHLISSLLPTLAPATVDPLAAIATIPGTSDPLMGNALNQLLMNSGTGVCCACLVLGTTRCMTCSSQASILQSSLFPRHDGLAAALTTALSSPPAPAGVATSVATALLSSPLGGLPHSNSSLVNAAAASLLDLEVARKQAAVAGALAAATIAAASSPTTGELPHVLASRSNLSSLPRRGDAREAVPLSSSESPTSSSPPVEDNSFSRGSESSSQDCTLPPMTLSSSSSSSSIECLDSATITTEESKRKTVPPVLVTAFHTTSCVVPSHDAAQKKTTSRSTQVKQQTSEVGTRLESPSSAVDAAAVKSEKTQGQESDSAGVYGDADESALFYSNVLMSLHSKSKGSSSESPWSRF